MSFGGIVLRALLLLLLGILGALSFGLWGAVIGLLAGVAAILLAPYLLRSDAFSARARS